MHWTTGPRGTRPPAAPAPRYTPRAREARGAAVTPLTSLGSPARRRSSSPSRARLLRPRGNRSPRAPPSTPGAAAAASVRRGRGPAPPPREPWQRGGGARRRLAGAAVTQAGEREARPPSRSPRGPGRTAQPRHGLLRAPRGGAWGFPPP